MKLAPFLLCVAAAAQSSDQTGGVRGVVTDSVTRVPVKKVMVSITSVTNNRVGSAQSVMTDAGGTFTVANLQPGKYRLTFQQQNYPSARFGGVSKNVEVKAGETAGPLEVSLVPGGAVSGRVVDEDGDPVPGCYVQVHPSKHPQQGVNLLGNSPTTEDGDYRAFGIAPGKYILSLRCQHPVFQPRPLSSEPDPPPSRAYPPQFYPLANDAKSADIVELTAGTEKSGIDFQLRPMAVTQVHGTFSATGIEWNRGEGLQILLTSTGQRRLTDAPSIDMAKGTFEFREVFPGSYTLVAFTNGSEDSRVGAWQQIEVADQPVHVAVELRHGLELSGKIEIESGGNTASPIAPNQFHCSLTAQPQIGGPDHQAQVNDDGTFTLKGVTPGRWRVRVAGPGFLKSAWLGNADVTNTAMDLSGGAAGTLRVLVSTNTASIRGAAAPGAQIIALLTDEEGFISSNHVTLVDQNGQYKLDGLAPGTYRLAVMGTGNPFSLEGGQEVTVHEGETRMFDLKEAGDP